MSNTDELIGRLRHLVRVDRDDLGLLEDAPDALTALQKQVAEQAVQIEALRADAERYRKWRDDYSRMEPTEMLIRLADALEPDEVDAAIDAAIKAGKAVQG